MAKVDKGVPVVLSIDPGLTTGWACVDLEGKILGTGNLMPGDLEDALDHMIRLIHRNGQEVSVILEEFPLAAAGGLATDLRRVVNSVEKVLATYEITPTRVLPGVWKTSAVGMAGLPEIEWDGQRLSPHQKDAIRMARYLLSVRRYA